MLMTVTIQNLFLFRQNIQINTCRGTAFAYGFCNPYTVSESSGLLGAHDLASD